MGKVIKILLTVLSVALLCAIILPLAAALLLTVPSVQNFAAQKATTYLSSYLGTTVSLSSINIRGFDNVVVDDLYLADLHNDTMLYATKVKAHINKMQLLAGNVSLNRASIDSGKIYLLTHGDAGLNVAELIRRFSKPKDDKPSRDIIIRNAQITNTVFRFVGAAPVEREGRFNGSDIEFRIDRLESSKLIVGEQIIIPIDCMVAHEKCGWNVDMLTAAPLTIGDGLVRLDDATIQCGATNLYLDLIDIRGSNWHTFSSYVDSVNMNVIIDQPSSLNSSLIGYFTSGSLPSVQLDNLSVDFDGTVNDFAGMISAASFGTNSTLSTRYMVKGATDFGHALFAVDNLSIETDCADIQTLASDLAFTLSGSVKELVARCGRIGLSGEVNGTIADAAARLKLSTAVGELALDGTAVVREGNVRSIDATVATDRLDLGALSANDKLGAAAVDVTVTGVVGGGSTNLVAKAAVPFCDFNGYTYRDLDLSGNYSAEGLGIRVETDEENVKLRAEASITKPDELFDVDVTIDRFDFFATRFNKTDSTSLLRCRLTAQGTGSKLDDLVGRVSIGDIVYTSSTDTVKIDHIDLTGQNTPLRKQLTLRSSIADVAYNSPMDYKRVFDYLKKTVAGYVPSIVDNSIEKIAKAESRQLPSNEFSTLTLKVKSADNVAGIFVKGLQIAEGTELNFRFNPDSEQLKLTAHSPYLEYNNLLVTHLNLDTNNQADSLLLKLTTEDFYLAGYNLRSLGLGGGAKRNSARVVIAFDNSDEQLSARIDVGALFKRSDDGKAVARFTLGDSWVREKGNRWLITADSVVYASSRLEVDKFRIGGAGQQLTANGVLSDRAGDSLRVSLASFDLSLLNPLLESKGYRAGGSVDGYAQICRRDNAPFINARFDIDSLALNDAVAPPMRFESNMDFANERVVMNLRSTESRKELVRAYYRPKDKALMALVSVGGIPLSLLDPVMSGVLIDNSGIVSADLEVLKQSSGLTIRGSANVADMFTTVDYTRARYSIAKADVVFDGLKATLAPTTFADDEGNSGQIELMFDFASFSNLKYRVHILPENMLALNTTSAQNPLFYGKVYATGGVTIAGSKRGVNMDIAATTSGNSAFYMPLSGSGDVKTADFMTFVNGNVRPDTSDVLVRKKMVYERRMNPSQSRSKMNISMDLTVKPNTEFQLVVDPDYDNVLKARGNAALNLTINPRDNIFTMYGTYDLTEGSYLFNFQNLIERQFALSSGSSITWTGDPVDASLNLKAVYKLKTSLAPLIGVSDRTVRGNTPVECIVNITDRLTKPAITFDVNVPNADSEYQSLVQSAFSTQEMTSMQFLYLIAFGTFYSDSSNSQNLNVGASAGSAIGMEILTSQLSNMLSSDDVSFDIHYTPRNNLTSDEVGIDVQKEIISNKLILELEGNYDTGSGTTTTSSRVTGGGSLTYVIDRSGNLVAKFYSRTIDRFDENQGLQENGLGIYYQHDFATFKELWESIRSRTVRKKGDRASDQPSVLSGQNKAGDAAADSSKK